MGMKMPDFDDISNAAGYAIRANLRRDFIRAVA